MTDNLNNIVIFQAIKLSNKLTNEQEFLIFHFELSIICDLRETKDTLLVKQQSVRAFPISLQILITDDEITRSSEVRVTDQSDITFEKFYFWITCYQFHFEKKKKLKNSKQLLGHSLVEFFSQFMFIEN